MRSRRQRRGRSVGSGVHAGTVLSHEIATNRAPTWSTSRKATFRPLVEPTGRRAVAQRRGVQPHGGTKARRGRRPVHAWKSHAREPGDPTVDRREDQRRPVRGRTPSEPRDARRWEVRQPRSTGEAAEQGRGRGGGGGKGADQGECEEGRKCRTQSRNVLVTGPRPHTESSVGTSIANNALPSPTQGRSPVREFRTLGSVRGAGSNPRPYRDQERTSEGPGNAHSRNNLHLQQ